MWTWSEGRAYVLLVASSSGNFLTFPFDPVYSAHVQWDLAQDDVRLVEHDNREAAELAAGQEMKAAK